MQSLETSEPILAEAVHEKHFRIVGAYHDLDPGRVEPLPSAQH